MPPFVRPLLNPTVIALALGLVGLWLSDIFGRVPMLMLVAGFGVWAAYCLLQQFRSGYRQQGIVALIVIAFYGCSAITSVKPEELTTVSSASDAKGFYQAVTESFLRFELTLPVQPDPGLLAAANPYSPKRDYPFVWDASYYKGKYYVYHGITPILTLFLPFRLITQHSLPTHFSLLILLSAGFLGSLCVLNRARKICGLQNPPTSIQILSVFLLGFASMCPLVLRRPSVYEVAIGSAYCFSMWGLFFLLGQFEGRGPVGALLASLFFGLCVGSRPTFGVTSGLLLLAFALQVREHWKAQRFSCVYRGLALLIPFAVVMFVLGIYNKLRFDAWTEFGLHYQLDHLDMYNMNLDRAKMLRGLAYYLFSTPIYSTHFPGIHANLTSRPFQLGPHPGIHEDVLGVFRAIPVTCFIVLTPIVAWYRRSRPLLVLVGGLFGFGCLMVVAVSNVGVSARYELDFVPSLLIASILVLYGVYGRTSHWPRRLFELLWVPVACFSILVGIMASVADTQNASLKTYHPSIYQSLRQLAWPKGARFDEQD